MFKKIITTLICLISLNCYAQPTPQTVFSLTGDFIKIGVSDFGTIGSKGNVSPGIMYDNTGTRTFNTAYDYLTPGAPFEGFTVKGTAGSTPFSVTNNNSGGGPLTGNLYNYSGIAYAGSTFDNRAVWISTNNANFDLTNDVRFNNTQKFIDITSSLTAKAAMTNLYFARFIDPDARAAAGDSSATTNTLGYSPIPASNVVFSEALASKYALGLYSAASSDVGTGISSSWSTDPVTYFSGTNNGNGDYTIGIGFKVNSMNIGDLVTFKYAYIFGPSTLTAGAYAVSSGAGGGTAGVVPGCTTGCEMEGVTPPSTTPEPTPVTPTPVEDSGPPVVVIPTVVSTNADYLYTRLSVFNREIGKKVLSINNNISETTTTVYTDLYSDGNSVVRFGESVNAETSNAYGTRIDQYSYFKNANERFNQQLNSNVYDRYTVNGKSLFSRTSDGKDKSFYVIAEGMQSNTSDTYKMDAQRFGFGMDKKIYHNWVVGAQFNYVSATLKGENAGGSMTKNHFGLYSLATWNDWILKTDVAAAFNNYKNNHSLNNIAELGPLSNSGSANGSDYWISNRLYTPAFFSTRAFGGITVGNSYRGAIDETGPLLTAMSYNKYGETLTIGEVGVRYDNKIYRNIGLIVEAGQTTNQITFGKLGVNYKPTNNLYGVVSLGQQIQNGVTNNIVQANLKIAF